MTAANIGDPQVIRAFRHCLIQFDEQAHLALSAVSSDVNRVAEWLKREQLAYWKVQVRKREELVRVAKSAYLRAAHGPKYQKKTSGVEERKHLNKMKRLKEEAEEKVIKVKRWTAMLEQKARPLLTSSQILSNLLQMNTPRALARLDQMLDSLDDYHRTSGGSDAPDK